MEDAYNSTLHREKLLRKDHPNIVTYWECCDLGPDLERDHEMAQFFKNVRLDFLFLIFFNLKLISKFSQRYIPKPMLPRDGFHGGRTAAVMIYRKCEDGEEGRYADVCSLYPYICKYGIVPIGHPQLINRDFEKITENHQPYFGKIKCKVLPPQSLEFQPLPKHMRGILTFPACRSCGESKTPPQKCRHNQEQRAIIGEWCTLELDKFLELGGKYVFLFFPILFLKKCKSPHSFPGYWMFTRYGTTPKNNVVWGSSVASLTYSTWKKSRVRVGHPKLSPRN